MTVDELLALLAGGAGVFDSADDEGNAIDQLAHALQCAAILDASGGDDDLVVAGLVHDIGHLAGDGHHARDHEVVGADLVRPLLGERVATLVALHVPAKRYLATTSDYAGELSAGSIASLAQQGGAMSDDERAAFAAEPLAPDALALRHADEAAKVVGAPVKQLEEWRPAVERVAATVARR